MMTDIPVKLFLDKYLPANHISALVDVRDTEEEAFNTGEALTEMTLWIVTRS